jgi:hypothetical protein
MNPTDKRPSTQPSAQDDLLRLILKLEKENTFPYLTDVSSTAAKIFHMYKILSATLVAEESKGKKLLAACHLFFCDRLLDNVFDLYYEDLMTNSKESGA